MEHRYFPVFIPTAGRKVAVFGGGNIAARRIKTLMEFDFDVTVIAPDLSDVVADLAAAGRLRHIADCYDPAYLEGCCMAVACTDRREVNRDIGLAAKARGILVSVCDNREECNFYFPAVAVNDEVTAGLAGDGSSHGVTRRAAAAVREIIKRKAY